MNAALKHALTNEDIVSFGEMCEVNSATLTTLTNKITEI